MSKLTNRGTSLDIQWLGFCAPNARGTGSIPGSGTNIPHDPQWDLKKKILPILYFQHVQFIVVTYASIKLFFKFILFI